MLGELFAFIKRNGLKAIIAHGLELYIGGVLKLFPGIEGLILRGCFYRMIFKKAGRNLLIYPGVYIIFSHMISAGKRVAINTGTYIDARGGLSLGDDVMVGPNCVISSCEHTYERTDIPMHQQPVKYGHISIGDDVWIGAGAFIRCGVSVGEHSIIAAGAVVIEDVPPWSVYGGIPGRVLKNRKPGMESGSSQ